MTGLMRLLLAALAVMALTSAAIAEISATDDKAVIPLSVGASVPTGLTLIDVISSKAHTLDSLYREQPLIILFVRSVDWCPYCQRQLNEWNEETASFTAAGYRIVSISYDTPDTLQHFIEGRASKISLYSDKDSQVIRAFGILNTQMQKGSEFYGIPYPAIFVVNRQGIITHYFTEYGYQNRPRIEEVKAALNIAPVTLDAPRQAPASD